MIFNVAQNMICTIDGLCISGVIVCFFGIKKDAIMHLFYSGI
jgi:hypothetical protein